MRTAQLKYNCCCCPSSASFKRFGARLSQNHQTVMKRGESRALVPSVRTHWLEHVTQSIDQMPVHPDVRVIQLSGQSSSSACLFHSPRHVTTSYLASKAASSQVLGLRPRALTHQSFVRWRRSFCSTTRLAPDEEEEGLSIVRYEVARGTAPGGRPSR